MQSSSASGLWMERAAGGGEKAHNAADKKMFVVSLWNSLNCQEVSCCLILDDDLQGLHRQIINAMQLLLRLQVIAPAGMQ